jgi:GNAT superfamily N-acetyltransferase
MIQPDKALRKSDDLRREDGFLISSDPARFDLDAIHVFLSRAYWSIGIPRETVARALAGSLCFGLYAPDDAQIGLARLITDRATFAYLCDVYVLQPYRRRGLGRWLVERALSHPELSRLRRVVLVTRDAHELYRNIGFTALASPEAFMEIHHPDVYGKAVV